MDSPEPEPEIDLSDLETELGRLRPGPITVDRDGLMFEAGRASARAENRGRLSMILTVTGFVIAVGFAGLFAREHAQRTALEVRLTEAERRLAEPEIVGVPPDLPLEPDSYLVLRRKLLVGLTDPRSLAPEDERSGSISGHPRPLPEPLRARGSDQLIPL